MERTFAIIKPDAVAAGQTGEILAMIQKAGFRIAGMKMKRLSQLEAEDFYARPPRAAVLRLAGEVHDRRTGGRDGARSAGRDQEVARHDGRHQSGQRRRGHHPQDASRQSIERNCVHGSDAPETAAVEIPFFFSAAELL